ncbi:beta-3 adrenergic receptor-like [Patiria miniata]|uniref:G-protein coupled receptors family 1 profile domain-containing protein n=1 Tax=Patiria miniata TaxID=46514 RepID=A0A913ZG97_PATMI|nr:beta-3 adrenergic receptor-like [Patiria miniata]
MAEPILALRIIKTIIGILGILDNGLVILVIAKVKFMHSLTNAFICHQAAIDLVGSLLLLLGSNIPDPDPASSTAAGEVLCRLWTGDALLWLFFVVSTFNLLGLTLERYFAIVYPLRYLAFFGRRAAAGIMLTAWGVGIALKSYSFLIYTVVDGACRFQRISVSHVMGPLLICLQYFLPAGVMLFCYSHITVSLKRSALRLAPAPAPIIKPRAKDDQSPDEPAQRPDNAAVYDPQDALYRARRNTFKTLVIVFVVFLICWSPSQITFFMFNVGWLQLEFTSPLNVFSTSMVAANCCINPIIYSFKYNQFQRGIKRFFLGERADQTISGSGTSNTKQQTSKYQNNTNSTVTN